MHAQSQGAAEIDREMRQLSAGAEEIAATLLDFKAATDQLRGAADSLASQVARLKT